MRLIDADELIRMLHEYKNRVIPLDQVIDSAPTIEEKTGEWIKSEDWVNCSCCGYLHIAERNYCSNCGARMVKGEEQ